MAENLLIIINIICACCFKLILCSANVMVPSQTPAMPIYFLYNLAKSREDIYADSWSCLQTIPMDSFPIRPCAVRPKKLTITFIQKLHNFFEFLSFPEFQFTQAHLIIIRIIWRFNMCFKDLDI